MSAASEGHPDGAEKDLDWGPGALRPWGDRKMYQDLKFNIRDLEVPNAQIRGGRLAQANLKIEFIALSD